MDPPTLFNNRWFLKSYSPKPSRHCFLPFNSMFLPSEIDVVHHEGNHSLLILHLFFFYQSILCSFIRCDFCSSLICWPIRFLLSYLIVVPIKEVKNIVERRYLLEL